MPIGDDFSIASNGDIRYTGTTANYTVIAFHRWLGDLMDDAQAAGNDVLDITDATASERSTDNIITLKTPFNIDDLAAQHLYDGSIIQTNGDVIYDGILVFANAGMYLNIMQNGKIVAPNFWTTGLNADATNGISHRFMLKVRTAASDIDGRRLVGMTRETGRTYSEFKINGTSRGNNVIALTYSDDLNDETPEATIKGWTSITNTEGYRLLDVNNDGVNEPYYSEWNKAVFTINQLYERSKWLSRRGSSESSNADVGSDFTTGNATINGQAQSFANGVVAQYLTRVRVQLKKVGTPTSNLVAKLYTHSGTFGSSSVPTGAVLATSDNLDVSTLTTSYLEKEIGFSTQYEMSASTNYVIAFEYTAGDASNYVQVRGLAATGTHAGNRAQLSGVWAAAAADDLWFSVYTSPKLYGISGERFRGVTHEVVVDTPDDTGVIAMSVTAALEFSRSTGSFVTDGFVAGEKIRSSGFTNAGNNADKVINTVTATLITVTNPAGLVTETAGTNERIRGLFDAVEAVSWTGGTGQMLAIDSTTAPTKMWIQLLTGAAPTDNQIITGGTSVATCLVNITVTERTLSFPFVGQSTGSAIIGAYGVGIELADLSASDKLTDLDNILRPPPNNVTFSVSGLVPAEDRVLVGPGAAGLLDEDQLTLSTSLVAATETAVVVTLTIPSDTPSSGTIRIKLNSGIFRRVAYTSFTAATFTIASTDFTADPASAPKDVFISYIDKLAGSSSESFTVVYSADRTVFVRVRDGGGTPIKTFETTGTVGSAGGSATAIRTSDS